MTTERLDRLNVHSGDVLLLRGSDDVEAMHRSAQDLRRALYARNLDDVTILVLAPETDIQVLDEAAMAAVGWERAASSPARARQGAPVDHPMRE